MAMAAPVAARAAGGKAAAGKAAAAPKPAAPKVGAADAVAAADAARDRRNDERVKRVHDRVGRARVGRFSVAGDGAGALLALIAYGPALAYVNGGQALAKQWFRAKFLNQAGTGGSGGTPGFLQPGDPGIPESSTPAPGEGGPWRGGADGPGPMFPQPARPDAPQLN